ncbi:MAG TPA: hypothetical protein VI456_16085 [Polyangia bacterium]
MRHLVWLSGVLLALSCAVDNSNLNVDAGGSGGAGGTSTGAGGSATGGGGGVTSTGGAGAGGNATGAGGSGTGGRKGTGGDGALGGTIGTGGGKGQGGQAGAASCDALAADYSNALTAAKGCTPGAASQCQQLVDTSLSCPGCKTYVNDVTMLNAIDDEWTAAGCASMPHGVCPAIACIAPGQGVCTSNPTGSGPGTGSAGTCSSNLVTPVAQPAATP